MTLPPRVWKGEKREANFSIEYEELVFLLVMDKLKDRFDRQIDSLRISITDRCNLRCSYCMPPEGIEPVLQRQVLTFEEINRVVNIFAGLGIKKIRLTGGEPLVRKGIVNLIKSLVDIKGIEEVALTTNGIMLSEYAPELKVAGVKRINVSLDTLKEDRFADITGSNGFYEVIKGIEKASNLRFSPIKINTVVIKGVNDDEIIDFINFSLSNGLVLRFIEFMRVTPLWREDYFMPIEQVKEICNREFNLEKTQYPEPSSGPAEYYQAADGIIGFIKTDLNNCWQCNRLRLTSTGELKLCLYETGGLSLNQLLRKGALDKEIRGIIAAKLKVKEDVDYRKWEEGKVYMSALGG